MYETNKYAVLTRVMVTDEAMTAVQVYHHLQVLFTFLSMNLGEFKATLCIIFLYKTFVFD